MNFYYDASSSFPFFLTCLHDSKLNIRSALDGQLEEALEAFSAAMAKYTCTPELAACFGDAHPRIRNLRRAAAWVAARLGRPLPPELAFSPGHNSGSESAPQSQFQLQARAGASGRRLARLAWRPCLDPDLWASRGIDSELQEVFLATYPADAVLQIGAWLANGPL
eukprot:tig00020908_g15303.t1